MEVSDIAKAASCLKSEDIRARLNELYAEEKMLRSLLRAVLASERACSLGRRREPTS